MVNLVINFLPTEWFFTISILQNKKLEACCKNVTQKSWPDCSSRNMLNHLNTFLRHDKHSFLQLGKFKSIVKQKRKDLICMNPSYFNGYLMIWFLTSINFFSTNNSNILLLFKHNFYFLYCKQIKCSLN